MKFWPRDQEDESSLFKGQKKLCKMVGERPSGGALVGLVSARYLPGEHSNECLFSFHITTVHMAVS